LSSCGARHVVGDSELLTLFLPDVQEFDRQHWSNSFGNNDIYSSYFDNLPRQTFNATGFSKFLALQRVDRLIYSSLADPIWHIHGNQKLGEIPFQRDDITTFRKFLYLMTSLGGRDRNMHLLAHNEYMESARVRRRRFVDNHGLDHVRDVWLRNVEQVLDTPHYHIPSASTIFDLDRTDYKTNAIERYMVFWEAAPGDEFILTNSAFGGFEGGQIGAKKSSRIDISPQELEQHLYTKDFMWHQLYVLSPNLLVALCHPTLMHPELTKLQRKRWGLRRSLLESLPHDLPPRYYKDMKKNDMGFSKEGWTFPAEVEKAFMPPNAKGYDKRRDDDIVFPIHRLTPGQVSMVNSVLLHNQEMGPKIRSVCVRPPPSYQCFYQSLLQFQRDPWPKYSGEMQNDYGQLLQRLEEYLRATLPPTPPSLPPNLPPNFQYQTLHPQLAGQQMYEARPNFGNVQYTSLSTGDIPRYDEPHLDGGRPVHPQAHSSTHSSLTSSFTPSSQSSYSHSSTSSQSSASTKTTSIDTPRFDAKQLENKQRNRSSNDSPSRRDHAIHERSLSNSSVQRSNTSGKSQKVKAEKPNSLNIVIEQTRQDVDAVNAHLNDYLNGHINAHMNSQVHGYSYPNGSLRSHERESSRNQPPSNPSSKKSSPDPPKAELNMTRNDRQRLPEPPAVKAHHLPPPVSAKTNALPEKKNYANDNARPGLAPRARTEPQTSPLVQARPNVASAHVTQSMQYVPDMQPSQRRGRSPERQYVPELLPQPPRRMNLNPENLPHREQSQRIVHPQVTVTAPAPQDRQDTNYELLSTRSSSTNRSPERNAPLVDSRGRRYETVPAESVQSQRSSNPSFERSRPHDQPPAPQRNTQNPQTIDSAPERFHHILSAEPESQPLSRRSSNRSPERQVEEPQRNIGHPREQSTTANGNIYEVVAPSQPQLQSLPPRATSYPQHHSQHASTAQPQAQLQPQPQLKPQPSNPQPESGSRNSSNSSEHPMRPGVEIVRGRPQAPTKLPAPPVVVEKVEPQESQNALVPLYHEYEEPAPQSTAAKQPRFETPTKKTISRKYSDLSLAGSMLVQVGDSPAPKMESDSDTEDSEYDETESESEEASWEDEGFAEEEEIKSIASKPVRRQVRFADKLLPSPKVPPAALATRNTNILVERGALVRKGGEMEGPGSRLGRRVEIPRPLSRNGQARMEGRKGIRHAAPHALRRD
jgi:hypothetical protein